MRITANIATYPPRKHSLKQCVASIYDQVDEIRICFNQYEKDEIPEFFWALEKVDVIFPEKDLTDNGKFYSLDEDDIDTSNEYYFTMDDDIIYPPNYVKKTIANIKKFGSIITYHGRILNGIGLRYYYDHQSFKCLGGQRQDKKIDVAGTGVTAFDTRYFHPKGLANNTRQRMSDMIFSEKAAEEGKMIGCCSRDYGWIKCLTHDENIFDTESRIGAKTQSQIADKIYKINNGIYN